MHALAAIVAARRSDALSALAIDAPDDRPRPFDRADFEARFAAAARRLGTSALGAEAAIGTIDGRPWSIAGWGLDEAGRALLLLDGCAHVAAAEQLALVESCYRTGGTRERQAVLRTLALLPDPERFLPIATDACRSSTQPVFEAIACENPYPGTHFPEASFNHLVMKAVFTEVALTRILELERRRSPELARMASDYRDERVAAGRSVPTDLGMILER